ncbi:biotin/lipoate A/B protein ligase family protein [Paraliobacillus sp. JSM ZJ581]|uniref:lipoate--protein ligase family protein n=1 Tax=Paraliobacillus sp. JSM ZJ581 TaxID=3342118 RepID=UPI0035A89C5C
MLNWKNYFRQSSIRLIDGTGLSINPSAMDEFAIDDALALSVSNQTSPPVIRLWTHNNTIVLGIPDSRIPYKNEAITFLQQQGYRAVVRNSGGLAVVLDHGVLNVSLLLADGEEIGIHEGYEIMVSFIKDILQDETNTIEAYEIVGSYCPGDYDLSINGKKFAGISQRRVRNGVAVQIYIAVEGDGQERAKLIQEFYRKGLQAETSKFDYPTVVPDTMRSLSQLLNKAITVDEMKQKVTDYLTNYSFEWTSSTLTEEERATYHKRKQHMIDRNKKALGDLV